MCQFARRHVGGLVYVGRSHFCFDDRVRLRAGKSPWALAAIPMPSRCVFNFEQQSDFAPDSLVLNGGGIAQILLTWLLIYEARVFTRRSGGRPVD